MTDGPYSQGYDYDRWGNLTHRYGWGGEVLGGEPQGAGAPSSTDRYYTYSGNRRADAGFAYDAAGNLTFDGGQHFTYDAAGRQVSSDWTHLRQGYDGDGLRVRKSDDSTAAVYYLRSSVLGGRVVCEIDAAGNWRRGYVYSGSNLLAVQAGGVFFVHEDPVTKSKRVTDMSGAVVSAVELDPYGAETTRGGNSAFQPKKFTTYERDYNGTDEAMWRRYNRWHARFDQPDPYNGSYDLSDPQSLNRYSYTQGDPVNFVDPMGLDVCFKDDEGKEICIPDDEVVRIYSWTMNSLFGPYFIPASQSGHAPMIILISTPGSSNRPMPSRQLHIPQSFSPQSLENFQYSACIGPNLQLCAGCVFDNEGVKPTVGASVGPSTLVSLQGSVGKGVVQSDVYLTGGFVLPIPGGLTFSTPVEHPISGFSGSDKNLGTPQAGVGVQYVFPPLRGTTKYDWEHHRDNPKATHKFLSPVGRCVD